MAYNENLANRLRTFFENDKDAEEKEMMGGLAIMLKGKMCVGVIKDELMLRIDPAMHEAAVEKKGCRTMDFTKRPMKGYVMVEAAGMESKSDFEYWMNLAIAFNPFAKASKKKKK